MRSYAFPLLVAVTCSPLGIGWAEFQL